MPKPVMALATVALLLENRPAFFVHYLALNALVHRSCRSTRLPARRDRLSAGPRRCRACRWIPSRLADLEKASRNAPQPPVIDHSPSGEIRPGANRPEPFQAAPGRDTECAMLYTSGTTGRPKGCILSNDYFITPGEWYLALGGQLSMEPGRERVLNPLPLYHMNALAVTATAMMCSGNCLISPDRFHPKSWWQEYRYPGNGDPLPRRSAAAASQPAAFSRKKPGTGSSWGWVRASILITTLPSSAASVFPWSRSGA
ncbi:MAG: hypothetical protein CM1200mP20_16270 [Pseudomonadota bacterium]|nr:MAG: hypothetical protein CM1200mP20_16270 [Pseudomonadota bacterium]